MQYKKNLLKSFTDFWKNKSLLGVMILAFVLTALLGLFFFLIDSAIILYLNKETLPAGDPAAFINAILNPVTIVTMVLVILAQAAIMVLADSFFKAGLYGMIKNTLQDGSTTFKEFIPEAKHFFAPMFYFLLLRYAIFLLIGMPFLFQMLKFLGTTPQFVTPLQLVSLVVTFIISMLLMLCIFFALMYGEAAIVMDKLSAIPAVKKSWLFIRRHFQTSIAVAFISLLVIMLAAALEGILNSPFSIMFEITQQTGWAVAGDVVGVFLNLITISSGIVASIFIFIAYKELKRRKVTS